MFTQPVLGSDFFGRGKILETLDKRVTALMSGYRQNIALTGQMLTGKTSILHHFLASLGDTPIIPIYVEVHDKSFPAFANKFMATVLYAFLRLSRIDVTEDMDRLIAEGERVIPMTTEAIKGIRGLLAKRRYNQAYRHLLEIPSVIHDETKKPCLVILDEFHNLEEYKLKNPFLHLGKIIMVQKNTMYIVSSSQKNTIKKILSEKLSLLFGVSPVTISAYYCDYLLTLSAKNPFYLSVISQGLKSAVQDSGDIRINVELLKEALADIMHNPSGTLHQHFTNHIHFYLDKKTRQQYVNILLALAQGAYKIKDIIPLVKGKERGLSHKLDYLISLDMVFKCGVFYKIQDRMFEFWLKNVYLRKVTTLIDKPHSRFDYFKSFIEHDVETYLIEYNKGILERLRDLFNSFNGELVEINGKTRKLASFIKTEVLKYGADTNYLSCETAKKYWICRVKYQHTEESDVIDFVQRTGAQKHTPATRILIPLGGIDRNALLLAKEKSIWVWDIDAVNLLLWLYKKQDLVL